MLDRLAICIGLRGGPASEWPNREVFHYRLKTWVERVQKSRELRRAFNLWQNKVLRAFAVALVLLALIGGRGSPHYAPENPHAVARVRQRTHQAALAEAAKAKGWEERERSTIALIFNIVLLLAPDLEGYQEGN